MHAVQAVAFATRLGLFVALGASCLLLAPVARAQSECLGFSEQTVIDEGTNGVEAILVQDLDGDGDPDIVSASFGDDRIFWYENDGTSFTPRLISDRIRGAADVFAADVSGDGAPDLVAAAPTGNSVVWFEQAPGDPPLFTARTVTTSARLVQGVYAADVDGDGHMDVLSASFLDDTIAWYEHVPGAALEPPSFTRHVIDDEADGAVSVFAVDLNGDDHVDVLSASYLDDTVAWYEHVPAEPGAEDPTPSFVKHVIDVIPGATSIVAHDLDGDEDVDVLAAAQAAGAIHWWPNNGGGDFGTRQTISDTVPGVVAVAVADVDGGGPDVLSASYLDDKIAWHRNDGAGGFAERIVSTTAIHANDVAAGDLDLDGHVDLLSASSVPGFPASQDKIAWYRSDGAAPPGFSPDQRISPSADGAVAAFAADLDGDTDIDVAIAGRTDRIAWYENDGAEKPAFDERIVSLDAIGAVDVLVEDLDGDGDNDLVSASSGDNKIAWYENDGNTAPDEDPLFVEDVVSTDALEAQDVFVTDVDGDGLPDILSASSGDGKIAWYRNRGTSPRFDAERVIREDDPTTAPPEMSGARAVHTADVDGDGDADVLAAFYEDGRIRWYENDGDPAATPSPGVPWTEHEVLDSADDEFVLFGATSVFGANLDGDQDVDILATAAVGRLVVWFESDGNQPPRFTRHALANDANEASSVYATDLDGDAFLDILAAVPGDSLIVWFESDGATPPVFSINIVVEGADFALSTTVADVNGDSVDGMELNDIVAGQRLSVSWFQASDEICGSFDVNDDDMLDGIELAWIGRAFGLSSATPASEWWAKADFTGDGTIDGDDLAYLASPDVFGFTTTDCSFICR